MMPAVVFTRHHGLHVSEHATTSTHSLRALKVVIPAKGATLSVQCPGQAPVAYQTTVITPPMCTQSMWCDGLCVALFFEPDDHLSCLLRTFPTQKGIKALSTSQHQRLLQIAMAHMDDLHCSDAIDALFDESFVLLRGHEQKPVFKDRRVATIQRRLQSQWAHTPPLADLAQSVGLSPYRLAHLFKRDMLMPIRPYALWVKLMQTLTFSATQPYESLTALAHQNGFSDLAHFSRTARKTFGQAPSYIQQQPSKIVQAYLPTVR